MALSPGEQLGHYKIQSLIGKGGMGEVYSALDTKLDREVAIKVLPAALSSEPDRLARFEREAKVLAQLNHTGIASIYGLEGRALVMEIVPGSTLAERIAQGPIPAVEAEEILLQIADALEYAHERGIVHRDLKPANIKIDPEDKVKILDFGLAKALSDPMTSTGGDPSESPTVTMGGTIAGTILGTAAYMAPEQARGKKVDKRADIWAFGVVVWEMLTGERLFKGEDTVQVLSRVLEQPPDLDRVPQKFRKLLARCLDRNVKDRLRDIGEARFLLQEVGQVPDLPIGNPPQKPQIHWFPWAVAAFFLLALMPANILHLREQPPERQVLQYSLPAPEKARNIQQFAISPDGHYLVMKAAGDGGTQLWFRAMDSLQTQPLAGTTNADYPFWSPDNRYIGFFADGKLKKIAVNGGPAQALCDAPAARGGTWGIDGRGDGVILFTPSNNGGLSRVPAAGGVPVAVTKAESGSHRNPTFLPDGRRFLYVNGVNGAGNGIFVGSLDQDPTRKGGDRRLAADISYATYFNGHLLFVRDQTLMAQPVDPKTMEAKGDLFPVAEQVARGRNTSDELYSISANGMLVYATGGGVSSGRQHLWFDRAGKELGPAGGVVRSFNNFALSSDGKRVVTQRSAQEGGSNLWITDLEHSTDGRFTFDPSVNTFPVWSPDGSKVAFASSRGGAVYNIYQRASNGTGQDELLLESKENKRPVDWSRDGRFIIFLVQGPKADDLWVLPVSGDKSGDKKPIPLLQSEFNKRQGQLSPDGKWLAYNSVESGRPEVYVVPFAPDGKPLAGKPDAGKWQVSTAGGTQPRWRADGKELFYLASDGKLMAVEVKATATSFERGRPQALFESRSDMPAASTGNWGYAPSADGKRFLISTAAGATAEAPPLTVVVNWLGGVKK